MIDVMTDLGDALLTGRIVSDKNVSGTDEQVTSAKLIYDSYKRMQKTLDGINSSIADTQKEFEDLRRLVDMLPYQYRKRHETVIGPITSSVQYPREDTIYFQKDSIGDKFWNTYIWMPTTKTWHWIDTTEPYIEMFWHKDETEELLKAVGLVDGPNWIVMPFDRIRSAVEKAFSVYA